MSAPDRDFDRIATAWLDLMPSEAPDRVIESVLQAVDTTPQVRRPVLRGPWRSPRMNRFLILIAAALLGVALIGGALLSGGSKPAPAPSFETINIPAPTPTPLVAMEGLGRGMGYATTARGALGDASYVADVPPGDPLAGTTDRLRLAFDSARTHLALTSSGSDSPRFASRLVTGGIDELTFFSEKDGADCRAGDYGRYIDTSGQPNWSLDVGFRLAARDERCAARQAALERSWIRALDRPSTGGRGAIVDGFGGAVLLVTLPTGSYTTSPVKDAITVEDKAADRQLIIVRNPHGYTQSCADRGGDKMAVGTTAAEFIAYLRTLPGFTIQTEPFAIDGATATHVTIPSVRTDDCPTHVVVEWTTGDPTFAGGWILTQGDTDQLYLVETGGDLYLLQWLGANMTTAEEQAVLGTVSITDALPSLAP